MKRRSIQNFLVVATSFFVLTFPAYNLFSSFSQINLFATDLNFENPDQDYLFSDQKDESNTRLLDGFTIKSTLDVTLFEQTYHLSSSVPSLGQEATILRC